MMQRSLNTVCAAERTTSEVNCDINSSRVIEGTQSTRLVGIETETLVYISYL